MKVWVKTNDFLGVTFDVNQRVYDVLKENKIELKKS